MGSILVKVGYFDLSDTSGSLHLDFKIFKYLILVRRRMFSRRGTGYGCFQGGEMAMAAKTSNNVNKYVMRH